MAFDKANLWPVNYANGNSLWFYKTADAPTAVDDSGYFNEAVNRIKLGDLVHVVQVDDPAAPAAVSAVSLHVVVANDGSTVDLSDDLLGATVTAGD